MREICCPGFEVKFKWIKTFEARLAKLSGTTMRMLKTTKDWQRRRVRGGGEWRGESVCIKKRFK